MDRRTPLTTESDRIDHLQPRTQRALAESMHVTLARSGGRYTVYSASDRYYDVDVVAKTCSCPDYQRGPPEGGCKHLRRVDMAIRAGRVPTPDGRVPTRTAADGGAAAGQTREQRADHDRIEGPIPEFDADGTATGAHYFKCLHCGREAMRKRDLKTCCPNEES